MIPLVIEPSEPCAQPNGARLLPPPPKSPLFGARRPHPGAKQTVLVEPNADPVLSGFDRMLLLRQMNVTGSSPSSPPVSRAQLAQAARPAVITIEEPEVSAAHNLKLRRVAEQKRREEMALMRREDYVDTPEGTERLKRQEERGQMLDEELRMRRFVEAEVRERRRLKQLEEQQEEARIREQYLAKMRLQREQQEREAKEKELARKQAMEAKMKALKEAADAKAREEAAARMRQMEQDALIDRERRVAAMETALMQLEDALSSASRQQWLAEMERQRQIEAEREQWRVFQEQEQAKLREATLQRRAAMAQQYEEDKRRKMEIHRLQKEQAAVAAAAAHSTQSSPAKRLKPVESEARSGTSSTESSGGVASPDEMKPIEESSDLSNPNEEEYRKVNDAHPTREDIEATTSPTLDHSDQPKSIQEQLVVKEENISANDELQKSTAPPSASQNDVVVAATMTSITVDHVASSTSLPKWTTETAQQRGLPPFAKIQSVTAGSPAMEAALAAGDLIVNFGGVIASTPKCLTAVAECVQRHVNQAITLVVLRPHETVEVTFYEVSTSLCPRKWKGKGLLGCQLSPYKWPEPDNPAIAQSDEGMTADPQSNANESTQATSTVIVDAVQEGSAAARAGICSGDILAVCGSIDMTSVESVSISLANAQALESPLCVEVERWIEEEQRYLHLLFQLNAREGESGWGFNVTTFEQYYYSSSGMSGSFASESPSSVCTDCFYSTTPSSIHTAACNGHIKCLEALLQLVDSSAATECLEWKDEDGRSPLFYACYWSQVESARFLILRTCQFDVESGPDLYGDTPLHAAVNASCSSIVELLLESHYIDPNMPNAAQQTCAHIAPNASLLRLVERLGADLLATDAEGRMPLAYACLRNDPESVEYLCSAFPDFADYADECGNTPLHLCAWLGLEEVTSVLLRFLPHIALFLTNLDGYSPADLARANAMVRVAELLEVQMSKG